MLKHVLYDDDNIDIRTYRNNYFRDFLRGDRIEEWCPYGWARILIRTEQRGLVEYDAITNRITIPDLYYEDILEIDDNKWKKQYFDAICRVRNGNGGYSQDTLSHYSGLTPQTINHYYNGKTIPSLYNATHIAKIFKTSLSEFYIDNTYPTELERFKEELDQTIDTIRDEYPSIYENGIAWQPINNDELLVVLENRDVVIYDRIKNEFTIKVYTYVKDENPFSDIPGYIGDPIVYISPTEWTDRFSRLLRDKFYESGITQTYMSDVIGVSRQMLSRYVKGDAIPNLFIASKMSKVFNCPLTDFHII